MTQETNKQPDSNTLALDRTVLANERTYQAWLRTGLSFLAAGIGVFKFLKTDMLLWTLTFLAAVLIVFSILAFIQAAWQYNHLHLKIAHLDVDLRPAWQINLLSLILVSASLLSFFSMFFSL